MRLRFRAVKLATRRPSWLSQRLATLIYEAQKMVTLPYILARAPSFQDERSYIDIYMMINYQFMLWKTGNLATIILSVVFDRFMYGRQILEKQGGLFN